MLMEQFKRDITLDEFKLFVLTRYPDYKDFVSQVENSDVADEVLQDSVQLLVDRAKAYDLALVAIDVSEGRKTFDSVLNYYEHNFKEKEEINDVQFVTDDLELIYTETVHTPGLRWRSNTLNRMLGSLRKGDFGFVFARPETGKTTFLASEVTFMCEQLGYDSGPILWLNNEEGGMKVKTRCYQASLGYTLAQVFSDRKEAHARYMEKTKGKLLLVDDAGLHKRKVETLCRNLKPSLVIFDQIDKVKGFDNDREDLRLGSIYIWARELAKSYCPVIGICQADVSGENQKWLNMGNVANAKTSKQAEADFILGIGTIHEIGLESVRYFHLSKNKLSGDEDTDPKMRHGRSEVLIRPEVARYVDIEY